MCFSKKELFENVGIGLIDNEIVNNIVLHGSKENILYIVIVHKLKPLENSWLEWHGTDIVALDDAIPGFGNSPKKSEPVKRTSEKAMGKRCLMIYKLYLIFKTSTFKNSSKF